MSEATLAEVIDSHASIMLSRPDDAHRHPSQPKLWGVYVGSHGGRGATLQKAIRACLMCCGLGEWWHVNSGQGELLRDFFERECQAHLGRGVYHSSSSSPA